MAGERDLERRVAGALHDWLDAEAAPHPRWEDAPARSRRPKARGIPAPVRLLAVAALAVGAAGGALWVGGRLAQPDRNDAAAAIRFCADVEDYAAPGEELPDPTAGPWPEAGPAARLTGGVLQPGDYAILGDERGPGALLRISDPRLCDRYPTVRPFVPGTTWAVVHMEMRVLRDGFMAPWVGGDDRLVLQRGRDAFAFAQLESVYHVPGIVHRTRLETPAGFEAVTDLVFTLDGGPADDLFIEYRPSVNGEDNRAQPAAVSWNIGRQPAREPVDIGAYYLPVDLSGPPASGRFGPGEWARVGDGDARYGVRVGDVGQVERYPAADPERGSFVEARISYASDGPDSLLPAFGPHEWRAVDGTGAELAFLEPPADSTYGVLNPLLTDEEQVMGGGWLVIDAPPEGAVILQYRRDGEGPVLFEVVVRPG